MPADSTHLAVLSNRVDSHEKNFITVWDKIDKFGENLNSLKVQMALIAGGFGVVQTIVTGIIVYKATRG